MPRAISARFIILLSRMASASLWRTSIISLALMTPSPLASAAWRRSASVEERPGAARRAATSSPSGALASEVVVMVSFVCVVRVVRVVRVVCVVGKRLSIEQGCRQSVSRGCVLCACA